MSYKEKISNIDKVLSELKTLKSEYQKAEKLFASLRFLMELYSFLKTANINFQEKK